MKVLRITILICFFGIGGSAQQTATVSGQLKDGGRVVANQTIKLVSSGAISRETADSLSNQEAFDLIFLRGVTTADKLSINAGRGVGMSIVKESVESRGGLITIDSESQRGTTFTIKIPTILATTLPEPAKPERVPGLQVLIVDDSASMRQMTSKVIEKAGWTAFTAKDGLDAIELLATDENRPDIILSDLEMPRLNGYELLETLKSDDNLSDIPVIMISSRSDDAHRQEAFELGAAEYLTKPYDEDALIEQINQVCVVNVRV